MSVKTSEVRIGNLFNSNFEVVQINMNQKIGTHTKEGSFHSVIIEDKHSSLHLKISDLQPIKLTKQWLYEFGFKSDNDENDELVLNGFRIYEINDSFELANHDFPKKLEFVHKLQNLYFELQDEELNINTNFLP